MKKKNKFIIRNLSKSFANKQILRGIDLEVKDGESLVIIGGSGSGKSVLLKTIIGLIKADKGSIKIDGCELINLDINDYSKILAKFGFLFQGGALFDSLTVWQNISFGVTHRSKLLPDEAKSLAIEKLALVGLESSIANLYPAELSGGMQKRVALARAITANPEVIFFDEPTTGLDPIMANIINDLIIKCSKQLGATTITITHDIQSAYKIADSVALLYQGQIIWHDNINKLANSNNEYVQQFINGSNVGPIKTEISS